MSINASTIAGDDSWEGSGYAEVPRSEFGDLYPNVGNPNDGECHEVTVNIVRRMTEASAPRLSPPE